jgi:putative membrane protein
MMWRYGNGGDMTWWMVLFAVLVVALLIAGMVALVLFIVRQSADTGPGVSDARRVLEERFARGEIDEEEFRKRASLLSSHGR